MMVLDVTTCLVLILTFMAAWLVFHWLTNRQKPYPLPPGPAYALPVIGHLYLMPRDPQKKFKAWRKQYGDIFSLKLGCQIVIVMSSYQLLKKAFVTYGDFFSHRPDVYMLTLSGKQKGVAFSSGEVWKEQRKMVLDILRELGLGRNTLALKIHEEVEEYLKEMDSKNGSSFDPSDLIHHSLANIICSIMFGQRYEYGDPVFLRFTTAMKSNVRDFGGDSTVLNFLPFLRFLPGDLFRIKSVKRNADIIQRYLRQQSAEHVKNYDEACARDLTSIYIREMKKKEASGEPTTLNEENLVHVIGDLFGAGTETTATVISWVIVYFLHYPQVQEKCFQEIQEKIGAGRLPTLQDKLQLPYVEATIMEVMRRANTAPFAIYHTISEDYIFQGYHIPKNAILLPFMESVLLDEETWGDPMEFRPERFLDDSGKCVRPAEFIPFFFGRRVCLGESLAKMELFLFLSAMIQRFIFLPPEDGTLPSLQGILGMTLSPKSFEVRAVPRK